MIEISDDLIYKSLRKMMQSAFSTGCNWVRCGSPKDQSTKAVPCAFYVPGGHAEYGEDAGSSSGFAALWSSIPWTPNPAGLILWCSALVSDPFPCKALYFTRAILLITCPAQHPTHNRSVAWMKSHSLRMGKEPPTCAWEVLQLGSYWKDKLVFSIVWVWLNIREKKSWTRLCREGSSQVKEAASSCGGWGRRMFIK